MIAPSQIHVTSGEVMSRNVAGGGSRDVALGDPAQRLAEQLRLDASAASLPAAAAKTRSPSSICGSSAFLSGVIAAQTSPRRPAFSPISLVASPSKKRPIGPSASSREGK